MTITSARSANPEGTALVLETAEAGAILICLEGSDVSGGWRDTYLEWREGHEADAYSEG